MTNILQPLAGSIPFSSLSLQLFSCLILLLLSVGPRLRCKMSEIADQGGEGTFRGGHERRTFPVHSCVVGIDLDMIHKNWRSSTEKLSYLKEAAMRYVCKESRNYAVTPIIFVCTHNRRDGGSSLRVVGKVAETIIRPSHLNASETLKTTLL